MWAATASLLPAAMALVLLAITVALGLMVVRGARRLGRLADAPLPAAPAAVTVGDL